MVDDRSRQLPIVCSTKKNEARWYDMDTVQEDVGICSRERKRASLFPFFALCTITGMRRADGVSFVDVDLVPECANLFNQALLLSENLCASLLHLNFTSLRLEP